MCRAGNRFESAVEYALDERIKVAMHYREGEEPLETIGVIVRVIPGANCQAIRRQVLSSLNQRRVLHLAVETQHRR